jgi:hypothetical protein
LINKYLEILDRIRKIWLIIYLIFLLNYVIKPILSKFLS